MNSLKVSSSNEDLVRHSCEAKSKNGDEGTEASLSSLNTSSFETKEVDHLDENKKEHWWKQIVGKKKELNSSQKPSSETTRDDMVTEEEELGEQTDRKSVSLPLTSAISITPSEKEKKKRKLFGKKKKPGYKTILDMDDDEKYKSSSTLSASSEASGMSIHSYDLPNALQQQQHQDIATMLKKRRGSDQSLRRQSLEHLFKKNQSERVIVGDKHKSKLHKMEPTGQSLAKDGDLKGNKSHKKEDKSALDRFLYFGRALKSKKPNKSDSSSRQTSADDVSISTPSSALMSTKVVTVNAPSQTSVPVKAEEIIPAEDKTDAVIVSSNSEKLNKLVLQKEKEIQDLLISHTLDITIAESAIESSRVNLEDCNEISKRIEQSYESINNELREFLEVVQKELTDLNTSVQRLQIDHENLFADLERAQERLENVADETLEQYSKVHTVEDDLRSMHRDRNPMHDIFWLLLSWILTALTLVIWTIILVYNLFSRLLRLPHSSTEIRVNRALGRNLPLQPEEWRRRLRYLFDESFSSSSRGSDPSRSEVDIGRSNIDLKPKNKAN